MKILKSPSYQKEAKKEANLWDQTAKKELRKHLPDYRFYRNTLPYKIYRDPYVKKILQYIKPGNQVLELGCYNGWFSLEMARKGANVNAHDISKHSVKIAKDYYSQCKKIEKFSGQITYHVTDLNFVSFPKNTYDAIVIRNVLHHLINLESLFCELDKSLKKNGLILVDDALPSGKKEALITGVLLTLLPTDIPYQQKIPRVFKKGKILKRTQGLIDACGASPFEGVSGDQGLKYLNKYFHTHTIVTFASFIGTITAHLRLHKILIRCILIILNIFDKLLIKAKIIKGTSYLFIGKKK